MPGNESINVDANALIEALTAGSDREYAYVLDLSTGRVTPSTEAGVEGDRFRPIAELAPQEHLLIATEYVDSLPEGYLRDALETALRTSAPIEAVEEVLAEFPEDQREWHAFRRTAYREAALNWLDDQGIEANIIGG